MPAPPDKPKRANHGYNGAKPKVSANQRLNRCRPEEPSYRPAPTKRKEVAKAKRCEDDGDAVSRGNLKGSARIIDRIARNSLFM